MGERDQRLEEGVWCQVGGESDGRGIKVTEGSVEGIRIESGDARTGIDGEYVGLVNVVYLPVSFSQYRIVDGKEELVIREGVTHQIITKISVMEKSSYAKVVNVGLGDTIGPEFEIVDGVVNIEIPAEIYEDVLCGKVLL